MLKFKHADEVEIYEYDLTNHCFSAIGENDWLCWPAEDFADALNSGDYVVVTDES